MAGVDDGEPVFVACGDARFDLEVGGRSWFFYTIERLNGIGGFRDSSHFLEYADMAPGDILYEVQEAYHPPAVTGPILGPRTVDQLVSSLPALEIKLSEDILAKLDEIWPGPGGAAPEAYAW